MALFYGAAIQVAMEKGLKQLGEVSDPIIFSETWGEKLEKTVSFLKPTIDKYLERTSDPDLSDLSAHRSEQFKDFQAELQRASDLVRRSDQIHRFDIMGRCDYGNKIREFNEEIKDFIDIQGPPSLALDLQKVMVEIRNFALDLQKVMIEIRNFGRGFELMERLILQKINPTQLSQTPVDGIHGATAARQSNSFNSQVPDMPKKLEGLDKPINDVKQILMKSDVNIVGITGMGGSGKTTLASSALCKDPQVEGEMEEQDWCQIDFPEVEALTLFSAASQYCLPTFLQSMPKLKVIIIYNYGSKRAILSGLPSFPSPVQIRSVFLNKLIVPPPLYKNCRSWERLEKLYVCLCEGLGNITLKDMELEPLNFPNVMEINIDHCSDLGELPVKLCDLTSLERLAVTNCHFIQNLPDKIGRLKSLRVLRLSACPSLSRLPPSICKLGQLEYLDISLCRCLQDLPTEFVQLSNLKTLDMRECSGWKKLPTVKLRSLKRVIISESDKESLRAWLSIKASTIHNLIINVVPESFSLDWLDDH